MNRSKPKYYNYQIQDIKTNNLRDKYKIAFDMEKLWNWQKIVFTVGNFDGLNDEFHIGDLTV